MEFFLAARALSCHTIYLFVCLSVDICVYLSAYVCLSLSLSLFPHLTRFFLISSKFISLKLDLISLDLSDLTVIFLSGSAASSTAGSSAAATSSQVGAFPAFYDLICFLSSLMPYYCISISLCHPLYALTRALFHLLFCPLSLHPSLH